MDLQVVLDMVFGVLMVGLSFILRRFFTLIDQLREEDKELHNRITKVQTSYVTKHDFEAAVDRIISHIDRLEERFNR